MRLAPITLVFVAACGENAPVVSDGPRNLILISIDTLRADRLGCYGYDRDTTPALDAFAEQSVRFERAYAPSSWTLPSHVSLLSGLLPSTHGTNQPDLRPGAETALLAEVLRDAGYYTFAHTDGGWISSDFDLDRGFLAFDGRDRDAEQMLAEATEALSAVHGKRPFFAFLHTYDAHCPYTPGPPWDGMFESDGAAEIATEGRCGNPHFNTEGVSPAEAAFLSDRYDGGVRRVDEALAKFLAFLKETGVLRDTVVVITSDHGEEFLEHGRIGHEGTLYHELIAVPLLLSAPGVSAATHTDPVSLVDLAPTLLELLDIGAPTDLDGRSLAPLLRGQALPPRPVEVQLDWNAELTAWVDGTLHLIEGPGKLELYDLANDQVEMNNLAGETRGIQLLQRLESTRAPTRRRAPLPALPGAETAKQLSGLGYSGD